MSSCIICKKETEGRARFCPDCQGTLDRRVEKHKQRKAQPAPTEWEEGTAPWTEMLEKTVEKDNQKMEAQARKRGRGPQGSVQHESPENV